MDFGAFIYFRETEFPDECDAGGILGVYNGIRLNRYGPVPPEYLLVGFYYPGISMTLQDKNARGIVIGDTNIHGLYRQFLAIAPDDVTVDWSSIQTGQFEQWAQGPCLASGKRPRSVQLKSDLGEKVSITSSFCASDRLCDCRTRCRDVGGGAECGDLSCRTDR